MTNKLVVNGFSIPMSPMNIRRVCRKYNLRRRTITRRNARNISNIFNPQENNIQFFNGRVFLIL
jgi:hypothetical protein